MTLQLTQTISKNRHVNAEGVSDVGPLYSAHFPMDWPSEPSIPPLPAFLTDPQACRIPEIEGAGVSRSHSSPLLRENVPPRGSHKNLDPSDRLNLSSPRSIDPRELRPSLNIPLSRPLDSFAPYIQSNPFENHWATLDGLQPLESAIDVPHFTPREAKWSNENDYKPLSSLDNGHGREANHGSSLDGVAVPDQPLETPPLVDFDPLPPFPEPPPLWSLCSLRPPLNSGTRDDAAILTSDTLEDLFRKADRIVEAAQAARRLPVTPIAPHDPHMTGLQSPPSAPPNSVQPPTPLVAHRETLQFPFSISTDIGSLMESQKVQAGSSFSDHTAPMVPQHTDLGTNVASPISALTTHHSKAVESSTSAQVSLTDTTAPRHFVWSENSNTREVEKLTREMAVQTSGTGLEESKEWLASMEAAVEQRWRGLLEDQTEDAKRAIEQTTTLNEIRVNQLLKDKQHLNDENARLRREKAEVIDAKLLAESQLSEIHMENDRLKSELDRSALERSKDRENCIRMQKMLQSRPDVSRRVRELESEVEDLSLRLHTAESNLQQEVDNARMPLLSDLDAQKEAATHAKREKEVALAKLQTLQADIDCTRQDRDRDKHLVDVFKRALLEVHHAATVQIKTAGDRLAAADSKRNERLEALAAKLARSERETRSAEERLEVSVNENERLRTWTAQFQRLVGEGQVLTHQHRSNMLG